MGIIVNKGSVNCTRALDKQPANKHLDVYYRGGYYRGEAGITHQSGFFLLCRLLSVRSLPSPMCIIGPLNKHHYSHSPL